MASNIDNATPIDLLAAIRQACDKLDEVKGLDNADEQIRHVLSDGWHPQLASFDSWSRGQVRSVLSTYEKKNSAKDLTTAKQHKELADLYLSMVDKQFQDKAFQCLNRAIIWAPFSEKEFLCDCFVARSGMHHRAKNYDAALADIDRALFFQPHSLLIVQRKVALLKRLDRNPEAYAFVSGLLKNSEIRGSKIEKLRDMKKDLKRFKRSNVVFDQVDDEEELWPDLCLEVDSRLKWTLNQLTDRHVLQAAETIPAETVVVQEEPVLFVVRPESFHTHCNQCFVSCTNTFWPCETCTEVVFCSKRCATRADLEFHQRECGILGALVHKEIIPPQVLQVYRHLARAGYQTLVKVHSKIEAKHCPNLNELIGSEKISCKRAHSFFAQSASLMHQQISARQPLRSFYELTNAIYLAIVYCHKSNLNLNAKEMRLFVRILATELARVSLVQYGWYGTNGNGERVHIGNYQCLVGSRVSHSCEPNIDWTFDEKHFTIKALRAIEPGEEISISFGPTASQTFLVRQAQILSYMRMCNCKLCQSDAASHFSIRCTYCNGPVPFESNKFVELRCMQCERKFEHGLAIAKTIQADFLAMQRTIWLLSGVQSDEESATVLQQVETKMATLVTAIQTSNQQLLSVVSDLCREYIRRKMYHPAVEWFQWFAKLNILLDINGKHDLLTQLHHLEQWTLAYLSYLSSLESDKDKANATSCISVCKNLLQQMSDIIEQLPESGIDKAMALDKAQFEEIVEMLSDRTNQKWRQFEEINNSLQTKDKHMVELLQNFEQVHV